MKLKIYAFSTFLSLGIGSLYAQNVGIGTSTPNTSAKMDISATDRGVLIPRVILSMTTVAAPVTSPANSLLVYNTATAGDVTPGFYYWSSTANAWVRLAEGKAGWEITGNNGITAAHFMGSINAADVAFRAFNTERMRIANATGHIGIGTAAPAYRLDVVGAGGSNVEIRTTGRLWSNSVDGGMWLSNLQDGFVGNINGSNQIGFWTSGQGWNALNINKTTGNTGIGNSAPAVKLDISGALALRQGAALAAANGANNNVSLGATPYSSYRVTGPTAAFSITGLATGSDGQLVSIINTTAFQMTIAHDNASSTAANRFYIAGGQDLVLTSQYATATFQYNATYARWVLISAENGYANYWVRPTGQPYIYDYFANAARVYDNGQTWGYYYEGTNTNGSFFSGSSAGLVAHRAGQPSTDAPTFGGDVYPFADAGANADITAADNITYSGLYAYGGVYNGVTGIGRLDVGVRGIGLDGTGGTNASWPLSGVIGEVVIAPTLFDYGQQGVYGWQAAPNGTAPYCIGTYGVTRQSGLMSGGVVGQYWAAADDPDDGFVATANTSTDNFWGALGYKATNSGTYGYSRSNSAVSRGVHGVGTCSAGNPNYTYGGFFEVSGTQDGRAVYGVSSTSAINYAGYFAGNHIITGTKSSAFLQDNGKPTLVYCVESPEVWFEDFGSGAIQNGQVKITFPQDLMAGIVINQQHPAKIFVTPTDNLGNYWVEKLNDGFIVHAPNAANGATFDWRMAAKRKGYEDRRLDYAGADAAHDPYIAKPYSNPSNDSKVNWQQDLQTKTPAILEEMRLREERINPTPQPRPSSNVDKSTLEKPRTANTDKQ